MKRLNRVFALLLSVLLCFGIFPAGVFADENIVPIEIVFDVDISKRDDTVTAKVYVSEDVDFDTVGYSVKYNTENAVFLYAEEAENIRVARTKKDADAGILARSLYVSAGKTMTAEEGRILIDTVTFRMIEDGMVGVEFSVIEKDADFGRVSTYIINDGKYYSTEGKVSFITTNEELLAKAKEDAIKEIESYKDPEEYREAQKAEILKAVEDGIKAVNEAESIEAVLKALNAAKAVMDGVKTDAQLKAEEDAAHEHDFGKWEVTVEATCTENGEEKRVCDCGETETRTVEAKGHTEEIIPAEEATCKETGLTEGRKCAVCGEVLVKQEVIEAKGHKEEIIPGKAATETETGLTEGKKCSVCGEILVKQEVIPALGKDEEYLHGDANGDGNVDALDATQILRYANGKTSSVDEMTEEEMLARCDVNGDGEVNALDATQILRYANGKSSSLA